MMRRMFQMIGLAGLASLMLVTSARAETKLVGQLKEGTPVEFVGQVSSEPKRNEQKFQIAIGPGKVDYTAHISKARMWDVKGEKIDEDGVQDKDWVHGFGWMMDDPHRIRVNTLSVIAAEANGAPNTYFSRGRTSGWLAASGVIISTTKLREGTPVIMVAEVTSQPNDLKQEKKMQVKVGTEHTAYTLHMADAVIRDVNGKVMDTNDLVDKMWVRAEGYVMDDVRRVKVTRLVVLGMNAEDYRGGPYFSAGHQFGYLFQVDGDRVRPGKK